MIFFSPCDLVNDAQTFLGYYSAYIKNYDQKTYWKIPVSRNRIGKLQNYQKSKYNFIQQNFFNFKSFLSSDSVGICVKSGDEPPSPDFYLFALNGKTYSYQLIFDQGKKY